MNNSEKIYITTPAESNNFLPGVRVAPNEGNFPIDALVKVVTEEHVLTFAVQPKVDTGGFKLALTDALPPISDAPFGPEEVFVDGDKIIKGREFSLTTTGPILAQKAFNAATILANIESREAAA